MPSSKQTYADPSGIALPESEHSECEPSEVHLTRIDIYSPFPHLKPGERLNPKVKNWRSRIKRATAGAELACIRTGGRTAEKLYSEEDLQNWVDQAFSREEAIRL